LIEEPNNKNDIATLQDHSFFWAKLQLSRVNLNRYEN